MSNNTEDFIDPDGDGIRLEFTPIVARFTRLGDGPHAGLSREAVMRLHTALGEWLYPTGVTLPVAPLTPSDVKALVAQTVAEILPLHQSPQNRYVDACATDPEPRDVGHPSAPAWDDVIWNAPVAVTVTCPECRLPDPTHLPACTQRPGWSAPVPLPTECTCTHRYAYVHDADGCTYSECKCAFTRTSQSAPAPRSLVGCECGHRWGLHGRGKCHAWDGARECTCTRRTQADDNNASARCGECNRLLRFGHMHGCSQRVQP